MITLDNLKQIVEAMQDLVSDLGCINWVTYDINRHNFLTLGNNLAIWIVPVWYETGFNDDNILKYTSEDGTTEAPMKCVLMDSRDKVTYYNPSTKLETFYHLIQTRV